MPASISLIARRERISSTTIRPESMVRGVLFDVHDTLLTKDYRAISQGMENICAVLAEAGYRVTAEENFQAWKEVGSRIRQDSDLNEVTFQGWWQGVFQHLGIDDYDDGLIERANDAWGTAFVEGTRALPHAREVLIELSKRGWRLGVVSNSLAPNTRRDLTVAGLLPFFQGIFISSDVGKRKPHPYIFHKALEALNMDPEEAIFVGDNPYEDILGAKRVGLRAIFIRTTFLDPFPLDAPPPDATINSLEEIVPMIDNVPFSEKVAPL